VIHKREDCLFKEADYKKTSHIAKVCLSKGKKKIETIHLQNVLGAAPKHRKYVEILFNGKKLSMQLDTGADVTIIGTRAWMNLGCPLQPYSSSCVNVWKKN